MMTSELVTAFTGRIRSREPVIGYWSTLDAPMATERISRLGYDFVTLDAQHGLLGYSGILHGLLAIDAGQTAVGLVRVENNDLTAIGKALDAGAVGVIVPLVNTAADAAAAVAATKYPPVGGRSYGPARSALRIGPVPAEANAETMVFAMIETPDGLANVQAICATAGLDGIFVGPSDLTIAVGGSYPGDPAVATEFNAALETIAAAAAAAGVAAGIYTPSGDIAAQRLRQGYTFVTIASDLTHLEQAAAAHLAAATADRQ